MKKTIFPILYLAVLLAFSAAAYAETTQVTLITCTDDAKVCEDGTTVQRNPNNECEFYPCQSSQSCSDGMHEPGETWKSGDGCNTCSCDNYGRTVCTMMACPVNKCRDSDGVNYYTKGYVEMGDSLYGENGRKYDTCSGDALMEYYCQDDEDPGSEYYKCPNGCRDGACIKDTSSAYKEQVKCVFESGSGDQKCYNEKGEGCTAIQTRCGGDMKCGSGPIACVVDVSGYKGEKITWKSSCGGYAYTTIDGNNEYANFQCGPTQVPQPVNATITPIRPTNGTIIVEQCPQYVSPGPDFCKDGEIVELGYDENGCQMPPKCIKNSICPALYEPVCGSDGNTYSNSCIAENAGVKWTEGACEATKKCENGCLLGEKCMPYGFRYNPGKSDEVYMPPVYCDIENDFKPQKAENEACQNNYECASNQCSNGHCVDLEKQLKETQSTLNRIMEWLKGWFK